MLWELCTLCNIWVCYGKQHDTLHNQTDYTKTESDLGGTVDSWVCVKLLSTSVAILSGKLINSPRSPGHSIPNQSKSNKKIVFRPEVVFHKEKKNVQKRCFFFFLVWIAIWIPFSSWCFFPCNGANLVFSINVQDAFYRPEVNIQNNCFLVLCYRK